MKVYAYFHVVMPSLVTIFHDLLFSEGKLWDRGEVCVVCTRVTRPTNKTTTETVLDANIKELIEGNRSGSGQQPSSQETDSSVEHLQLSVYIGKKHKWVTALSEDLWVADIYPD